MQVSAVTQRHNINLAFGCDENMLFMSKPKVKESGADIAEAFLQLIQALLKDPEARQNFFAVKLRRIPLGQTTLNCFGICRNHTVFELDFLFVPSLSSAEGSPR